MARVRTLTRYMGPNTNSSYESRKFCGVCSLDIGGVYGHSYHGRPKTPADIERESELPNGWSVREMDDDEGYRYYAFCPWCGVKFDDEWWMDRTIENERAIDHYENPGHHKGDTHEFRGDSPDCFAGHYLSTNGDELCWCGAVAEPSILGCTIRHTDADYETVMAEHRAAYEAQRDDPDNWLDDDDQG